MAKSRRKKFTTMYPAKKGGKKPITFRNGSLHRIVGVKEGGKIPAAKMTAARAGKYGAAAKKKALFAKNILAKGRRTAKAKRG